MNTLRTLRCTGSNAALTAGLAVGMSAIPMFGASAQTAVAAPATGEELPTVVVEGEGSPDNTLEDTTGLSRLPGTIQDTPQAIQVINQQTMQQQGVTTLEQALRNVPGVTVGLGEGGGGMNGDQFRIRGFQAKGDIFVDGLRDFGVYVRDSFATESVEVLFGPSSESFGFGTTGGAINQTQKTAHLGDKYDFEGMGGNGPLGRAVVDLNKQISDTMAVRLVGMYTDQDIVDRDNVFNDRWGLLGSVGFGLGTTQTLTLNYLFQQGERKPDLGVPIATPSTPAAIQQYGSLGRPVTEVPGVSRSNFYGKQTDIDDYDVNMFTARYRNEVNEWLTVTNDTRVAAYSRYFAQTVTSCTGACAVNLFDNNAGSAPVYGFGGPAGFQQDTWGAQNVTTLVGEFYTGTWRHEMVAGVDLFIQEDKRTQLQNVDAFGPVSNGAKGFLGTIYDPNYESNYWVQLNDGSQKRATSTDAAAFISDRIWFVDTLSLLAGIRFDNYSASYEASTNGVWTTNLGAQTSFASPKASLIWEPTDNQTYYVSWAVSYSDVAGQFISNDNNSITNQTLEPARNEIYEVGGKISLLDGRLGLTGSVYSITKDNAQQEDAAGYLVPTGEKQRVNGVDIGLTGNITEAWVIQAAYAYMDSEILTSASAPANIGNVVPFVPENSFSFWTTYDIAKTWTTIPGELLVGLGVSYQEETFANSQNTSIIPEYFSLDALVSYKYENYRIALNGYNLTDEVNYTGGFANRASVGPGRAFTITVGATF